MKRVWIKAGETVHVEGIPCRVAEDASLDINPHNLPMLMHVRLTDTPPKSPPPEAALIKAQCPRCMLEIYLPAPKHQGDR